MRALGRLLAMGEFIASSPMLQRAGHRIKRVMIVFLLGFSSSCRFLSNQSEKVCANKGLAWFWHVPGEYLRATTDMCVAKRQRFWALLHGNSGSSRDFSAKLSSFTS